MSAVDAADLAGRHAPLVTVSRDDPPGDPNRWLAHARLHRFDGAVATPVDGATSDPRTWPADAFDGVRRPFHAERPDGYALVPSERHIKLIGDDVTSSSPCGRVWPASGVITAPCLYELEAVVGGTRITYWLFFPTSTTPASNFSMLVPALVDLMRPRDLPADAFPPIRTRAARRWVDRWWERHEERPGLLGDLARSAREIGRLGHAATGLIAAGYQLLGADFRGVYESLYPAEQDRIDSLYVHEGDWEGISVDVDSAGERRSVAYWGHGHPIVVDATDAPVVPVDGVARLHVAVARASHASFPAGHAATSAPQGSRARLEKEVMPGADGVPWRTWDDLGPVTEQPWYGFGGAWGRARLPPFGLSDRRQLADFDLWRESTGPLGPSPAKTASQRVALEPHR